MKLWLDDVRLPPEGWFWAKTAQEAISVLSGHQCTHISFDHDLGEDDAGTGKEVAAWIEEQAYFGQIKRLIWTIHSANPVGRLNIEAAMRAADKFWAADEKEINEKQT